jgi:hypothetical protein
MQQETIKRRTLIRKLLQKNPDKAVVEELGKLLVGHPDLKIPIKDLASATARLKVELRKNFGRELTKFYRKFLDNCLRDKVLTPDDWKALHQIKILFGFTNAQVERIHNQMVMRHYSKSVEQALSDKKINPRERSFLKTLQQNFRMPPAVAERIYRDKAAELVQRSVVTALSDKRLSPQEEKEVDALAHQLGVRIDYDERTHDILDRYRLFWLIENGEIPSIESAVKLNKGEKCYFTADANWCELQTITKSARYGRTANGSDDGDQVQRQLVHELNVKDSGRVYLTNKRIVFSGENRLRIIPYPRIKDFVPMENGIQIHRKSGVHPFLQFELGIEVFSLMLARQLRDLHS